MKSGKAFGKWMGIVFAYAGFEQSLESSGFTIAKMRNA
jgi:hypothetical protein